MVDIEPSPEAPTSPITIKNLSEEGNLVDEGALDEDHLLPSPPASPSIKQIPVQPESNVEAPPPPAALATPVEDEQSLMDEQPPVETATNGHHHEEEEDEVKAVDEVKEEVKEVAIKPNGTNGAVKKVEAGVGGVKKVATSAVGGVKKILESKAFGGEFWISRAFTSSSLPLSLPLFSLVLDFSFSHNGYRGGMEVEVGLKQGRNAEREGGKELAGQLRGDPLASLLLFDLHLPLVPPWVVYQLGFQKLEDGQRTLVEF